MLDAREVLLSIAAFFAVVTVIGVALVKTLLYIAHHNAERRNAEAPPVGPPATPTFNSSTHGLAADRR